MRKQLMYSGDDQLVYLVWEMQNDRPVLVVICTTDADLNRYVSADRKTWHGRSGAVFVEKVATDHIYGAHDASIARNLLRRS